MRTFMGFPHSKPSRAQSLIIVALMFVVLFGFAGLALDAGHLFLVHRNAQNAADAAALAAGKRLLGSNHTAPPVSSADAPVKTALDIAATNGFPTGLMGCQGTVSGTPSRFHTSWFDTSTGTCAAPAGFTNMVEVYSPPRTLVSQCVSKPYNCIEVVITQRVQNFLMGALGQPISVVSTSASVYADPAAGTADRPALAYALYLYEPTWNNCTGPLTCLKPGVIPTRTGLACGVNACPTFWTLPNSNPQIRGVNGSILSTPADTTAVESNGDMLIQAPTTFCDPNGGANCPANGLTGAKGFALNTGAALYCSGFAAGAVNAPTNCTTGGPGGVGLGTVYGNETNFFSTNWPVTADTSGLPSCGVLVLNGESVASHYAAGTPCAPTAGAPYTIHYGHYDSIVINHGFYVFGSGLYSITGRAPVNTNLTGTANGIDHSRETAANDWDLCNPGTVTGCTLTAGVWIGHGTLNYGPFVAPTAGASCTPVPTDGGGGDLTAVVGAGVTFVLGPSAGGFVSTREVDYISIVGPGLGAQPAVKGAPILIDLQNDNFIHLDGNNLGFIPSNYKGIIYQDMNRSAGGVEIDPGMGGSLAALTGQVYAYSFATFGRPGVAVDFTGQYGGTATTPTVSGGDDDQQGGGNGGGGGGGAAGGGTQEPQILVNATLQPAPGRAGYEQIVMTYADEWKLDAYSAYVTINGGQPIFFSQGIWSPVPPAGSPLPPANNNPGDAFPANAGPDPLGKYTKPSSTDWVLNFPAPGSETFEVKGDWVWGHQQQISGASTGNYTATLTYTFPTPAGTTVTISMFMTDGDRCGDYATSTWTFNNVTAPNPGAQVAGTVHLVN
ncbi:MAG: pilus assembly protein TadG-related protein [Candidatus Dormibacteraeota bacterium]|nr:pilus assembly protein TadG-related protein [Candidatus Dormibacteraeota bacterium]